MTLKFPFLDLILDLHFQQPMDPSVHLYKATIFPHLLKPALRDDFICLQSLNCYAFQAGKLAFVHGFSFTPASAFVSLKAFIPCTPTPKTFCIIMTSLLPCGAVFGSPLGPLWQPPHCLPASFSHLPSTLHYPHQGS